MEWPKNLADPRTIRKADRRVRKETPTARTGIAPYQDEGVMRQHHARGRGAQFVDQDVGQHGCGWLARVPAPGVLSAGRRRALPFQKIAFCSTRVPTKVRFFPEEFLKHSGRVGQRPIRVFVTVNAAPAMNFVVLNVWIGILAYTTSHHC